MSKLQGQWSDKYWEPLPWKAQLRRNGLGLVTHAEVLAAKPRIVYCTTLAPLSRTFAGRSVPTEKTKMTTTHSEAPAVVADCGHAYAGLAPETIVAHACLIAAAPELYKALEELISECSGQEGFYTLEARVKLAQALIHATAVLAKARGEQ